VLGELLLKDILHDHKKIFAQLDNVKASLSNLDKFSKEELLAKRLELINSVNDLRDNVVGHANYEEQVLNMVKTVFEKKPAHPD